MMTSLLDDQPSDQEVIKELIKCYNINNTKFITSDAVNILTRLLNVSNTILNLVLRQVSYILPLWSFINYAIKLYYCDPLATSILYELYYSNRAFSILIASVDCIVKIFIEVNF